MHTQKKKPGLLEPVLSGPGEVASPKHQAGPVGMGVAGWGPG